MVKNMKEITALDVLSVAKIQALITLVIGFLLAIFNLIITLIYYSTTFLDALGAIILVPIMYGVFGFVGGALGAWLYNKFAKKIGGMKISLK